MFSIIQQDTINLSDVSRTSLRHNAIFIYFISKQDPEVYRFESEQEAVAADRVIMNDMKALKLMSQMSYRK